MTINLDKDKSGFITKDEVKAMLDENSKSKKVTVTLKDFENFMKKYDIDKNGKLDYNEFIKFLKEPSKK